MYITKVIIKEIRQKNFITQKKLAELSGVSQSAISAIECGIKSPTIKILNKLGNALGIPTENLIVSTKCAEEE